jgi:hypothetical protein
MDCTLWIISFVWSKWLLATPEAEKERERIGVNYFDKIQQPRGGTTLFLFLNWTVRPDHLLLDRYPNMGPFISLWELDNFKNCWNKSFRTSKILTLLYQQFSHLLISQQVMSGPRLGALSNNRWSEVYFKHFSFYLTRGPPKFRTRPASGKRLFWKLFTATLVAFHAQGSLTQAATPGTWLARENFPTN